MKNYVFIFVFVMSTISVWGQNLDSIFNTLKFRNIGPFRGGRSNSGSGVNGDPLTYYMTTTGGGVWKTTDAGQHWRNISDGFFKSGSVGAISVSNSNPNILYVGMGEHAPRGVMTAHGDGVYKSIDAGETWVHLGLEKTQHISRIQIHPENPDILWVAAQGALHGKSNDRGIYKSTNGGKSWKKVLYVNSSTGASELSIDINHPNILYAAMWDHMRTPWKVISGGPGSGLYKSIDLGETWKKIENGIPKEKGKMAIAVSPANSNWVYSLVESDSKKEKGGLFLSKNGGDSWKRISNDHRLLQRAWYYIELTLDPNNENVVYVLSASVYKSINGGSDWEEIDTHHGDYHDLWINPNNSKNMLISNDGGSEITFDAGENWSRIDNMPTGQFYRVITDNLFPYNIYGGQQDNSSIKIASIGIGSGGIGREDWSASAGGESAFIAFDPDNPTKAVGGSYLGSIVMLDVNSRQSTKIMIEPNLYLGLAARDMKYLFNWNAPIIKSQHETNTYYHGSQYLLKTIDDGMSWDVVSPDLTRNIDAKQGKGGGPYTVEAVGAENYGTLSYVTESQHEAGLIYTGSDDGLVHITKNNGKTWDNITPKGLDETLINAIEVSPHDPATVYIATTKYKFNDHTPAIYKSSDYGKSWKNISKGIKEGDFTRVIREDPSKKDLIYTGTQNGIYLSWNSGNNWSKLNLNLPVVPITDMTIKGSDLVLATQGRAFWILDDLNLIRQYDPENKNGKLFQTKKTVIANWYSSMNSNFSTGTNLLQGVNPASGMVFYYQLPKLKVTDNVVLSILDSEGNLVNSFSSITNENYIDYEGAPPKKPTITANKGVNRFVWNMRHSILEGVPEVYIEGRFNGHKVIPGKYKVKLSYLDKNFEITSEIIPNPMMSVSNNDFKTYEVFMKDAENIYNQMTTMTNNFQKIKNEIEVLKIDLKKNDEDELYNKAEDLIVELTNWDNIMVQRLSKAYDDVENFENGFTAHYLTLINAADSSLPMITNGAKNKFIELNKKWNQYKNQAVNVIRPKIIQFNQDCQKNGIGAIFIK
ncbi:MAG: glycosyl hydrolase [Flavobacteriales bacterium]|nr:glycosyl hydrolase [Flavobacteriales bacterium]